MDGEDGIIDQDYSLNPGRYVGVAIEDDGMTPEEYKKEMVSLTSELRELSEQAANLEENINSVVEKLLGVN